MFILLLIEFLFGFFGCLSRTEASWNLQGVIPAKLSVIKDLKVSAKFTH
ncbi:hypothetical protein KUV26_20740 [Leisingera daeponensis]|uniref:Uncharacterized protein n=1 Tax=Leisingera daeponensis TaxID=405746 RepID=A0ABS7NL01_9RHOB|nr:hypothetical protein [Leisingera daeponensis]MBY6141871.1 hypothetical protein [Leisingera daeponensis]